MCSQLFICSPCQFLLHYANVKMAFEMEFEKWGGGAEKSRIHQDMILDIILLSKILVL